MAKNAAQLFIENPYSNPHPTIEQAWELVHQQGINCVDAFMCIMIINGYRFNSEEANALENWRDHCEELV